MAHDVREVCEMRKVEDAEENAGRDGTPTGRRSHERPKSGRTHERRRTDLRHI